jgi:5,10-methylenetetrahydromethanopterin reductase
MTARTRTQAGPSFWAQIWPVDALNVANQARRAEAVGWDGLSFGDTQTMNDDPYVLMAIAAAGTTQLQFQSGVSNPYTRHPSALANLALTAQRFSCGRIALGMGRGNSALAHLGLSPGSFHAFESYLRRLHQYLNGHSVKFRPEDANENARFGERIHSGDNLDASGLDHLDPSIPPVPLDIHTSGPRSLRMAATFAERITFQGGAAPDRVAWAIDIVRKAAVEAGRDPDSINFGTVVSLTPHPDLETAYRLGAGAQAAMAYAWATLGATNGPFTNADVDVIQNIVAAYDMNKHCTTNTHYSGLMTSEFIDRHFVVGPPERCIARLRALEALGVSRFYIVTSPLMDANRGASEEERDASDTVRRLLVEEVMPALRRETPTEVVNAGRIPGQRGGVKAGH